MSEVVYMPLLDEETECWRPVHAHRVAADTFEIEVEQEPGGERWAFPPHSRVRCRPHTFSDGRVGLVAFERVE